MGLVDEFGRLVTEQLEGEHPSVSTPNTNVTVVTKYHLAEIKESENSHADFAELAVEIRRALAASFIAEKRHPDIPEEKAKTIDRHARDFLRKIEKEYVSSYKMDGYKGVGETFVVYVIDVTTSRNIFTKINPAVGKGDLFLAYYRGILEYLERNMHEITADKGGVPYVR